MENESQPKQSRLAEIPAHIKDFAKTKLAYFKLTAIDSGASAASVAALGVILFLLGLFFLIFISIAAGIGLGYLVNNMAIGFLIVALLFLLLAFIIFKMRNKLITNPITAALINAFANDNNNEDHA